MSDRYSGQRERYDLTEQAEWRRRHPIWPEIEPAMQQVPEKARPRRRSRRRGPARRWWLVPVGLLVVVLAALGGLSWYEASLQGKIMPHVYVAGVDVGEMTPEDAEATLRLHFKDFQTYPVSLAYEGRVWRPTSQEIGLQVLWEKAVEQAAGVGHEGSFWQRWGQRWQAWNGRHDLLLPLWLDEARLRAYLEGISRQVSVSPLDAALIVEGQQVSMRPARVGRILEIHPTQRAVEEALLRFSKEPVELTVSTAPPAIDDAVVQAAMGTASKMLVGPIHLRYQDKTWTLTPEDVGQMLKIERRQEPGLEKVTVVLDQDSLREFVEAIADEVRVLPRNAHFRFVEDRLQVVDEGASGWELSVEGTVSQINEAVLSTERDLTLLVQEVPPQIRRDTVEELGIREVVAVGETSFAGSAAYRVHNILTAARILDGILIAPGETFSFIQSIGEIDESDGFVQGYSIVGGRTVLSVGGGVCQVSTTVFRAAFFAGLPIVERHAHNFRIGWYERDSLGIAGLDATIYTGTGTDLRFENNTAGYLLMQFEVYTQTGGLYVYLYGTKPNLVVEADGPYFSNWTPAPTEPVCVDNPDLPEGVVRQTDYAQAGVDVTVYRKIYVNGEEESSESFYSRFQAWPNIYEAHSCQP